MRWWRMLLVLVPAVLAPTACGSGRRERQAAVLRWLQCYECIDGEREAVRRQGERPVTALIDALLNGPPRGRLQNVRVQSGREFAAVPGGEPNQTAYALRMTDNYVATYQRRAIIALTDIAADGSGRAREGLEAALDSTRTGSRTLRPDVLRALEAAVATTGAGPFGGTVTPSLVGFLDTVTVALPSGDVVAGDSVVLAGSPFGNDVMARRVAGEDRFTFLAVGDVGAYTVSILKPSPPQLPSVSRARITIRSFAYTAQTTAVGMPNLPFRKYFGLRDTIEIFHFNWPAATPVTLRLAWPDSADVGFVTTRCPPPHFPLVMTPVDTTVVHGRVLDENDTELANVAVELPSFGLQVLTDPTGAFSLGPVPPLFDTVRVRVTRGGYEQATFMVPRGAGELVFGIRSAAAAHAPGTLRRLESRLPGLAGASCREINVQRLAPGPQSRATIVRLRLSSP